MTNKMCGLIAFAIVCSLAIGSCCRNPQPVNAPCPATMFAVQVGGFDTATAKYQASFGILNTSTPAFTKITTHQNIIAGTWNSELNGYRTITDSAYTAGTQTYHVPVLHTLTDFGMKKRYVPIDTIPVPVLSQLEFDAPNVRLLTLNNGNTLAEIQRQDSTYTVLPILTTQAGIVSIITGASSGTVYVYTAAGELSAIPASAAGVYSVTTAVGLSWLKYNNNDNMFYGIKRNPANGAYTFIKMDLKGNITDLASVPFDNSTYVAGACLDACNNNYVISAGQVGVAGKGTIYVYSLTGSLLTNAGVNYVVKGMAVRY